MTLKRASTLESINNSSYTTRYVSEGKVELHYTTVNELENRRSKTAKIIFSYLHILWGKLIEILDVGPLKDFKGTF